MAPNRTAAARIAAGCIAAVMSLVVGCGASTTDADRSSTREQGTTAPAAAPASPAASSPTPAESTTPEPPAATKSKAPKPSAGPSPPVRRHANKVASMRIPALGVQDLAVVPYAGTADDAPGTRIQDKGDAASPRGPEGGVGPGQVGNYVVTGHRTTEGAPFGDLPSMRRGQHVLVRVGGWVYDYKITRTMTISFRSQRSRASQSAPVPGQPGKTATRPMITLSTCGTPEDHAAGNFWSDEFGNPEHRIDKVGVLVDTRWVG